MAVDCYIGLGSNLQQPIWQIEQAYQQIAQLPETVIRVKSSLYQTSPLSDIEQPDFINAVALLETELPAQDLLKQLLAIETRQGRMRKQYRGPRCIDLDILLYADQMMMSDNLTVPHPGLTQREFVLFPLLEIAPNLCLPNGESIQALSKQCKKPVKKLELVI